MNIFRALLFLALCIPNTFADVIHTESTVFDSSSLVESEHFMGVPMENMRLNDYYLLGKKYGAGGDLFQQFVRFLFPISGREKRVMFMPLSFWGPKKPRYRKLEWKRFESDHFDFYAYPESRGTVDRVINFFEEEYDRNNRIFGLDSKFSKKIPVIFYQSRRDFEQTAILGGPIPEGLGGLTEILSWRRVTFPFEGEMSKLEHVAKHEETHVFQIAKKARRLPLWFIEGSAETNSVYWDSDAEMVIRDAFVNGFFFQIRDLWQIEGSWLMYKIGNFITNVVWEEYGENGFRKIFNNASKKNFETNLKESLGITLEELDRKVQGVALERYGHLLEKKDAVSTAKEIAEKKVLLDTKDRFFVSGGPDGPRNALYINYLGTDGKVIHQKFATDKNAENESFESFQKGASLTDKYIVYAVKKSALDELRILPYSFKDDDFEFEPEKSFSWKSIDRIQSPIWVGENKVAFIGFRDGFSDIYLANVSDQSIHSLTDDHAHYSDLDFSEVRNELVFSKEGPRDPKRIHYDRDLFTFHLESKKIQRITNTPQMVEIQPKFSEDGTKLLFVSNPDVTYDLMVLDFNLNRTQRITSMNVGALRPNWGPGGSVFFNTYKKMKPSIYQMTFPTTRQNLSLNSQKSGLQSFLLRDDGLFVPKQNLSEAKDEEPVLDGLFSVEKKTVIRNQGQDYSIDAIASLDNRIIVKASEGLPGDNRIKRENLPHFFQIDSKSIRSLKSSMVAQEGLPADVKKWADLKLNGRDITQGWMSQDGQRALLIVNNRLAAEADTYKKKPEVSLLIFDQQQNHLQQLEDGPIRSLDQSVQWVAFLGDSHIFIALGNEKSGPFEGYVYSLRSKSYMLLDQEVIRFRISPDSKKIFWKSRGYYVTDFSKPTQDLEYTQIELNQAPERIKDYELDREGNPLFFSVIGEDGKNIWAFTKYSLESHKYETVKLERKDDLEIKASSISKDHQVAVLMAPKEQEKKGDEQIWIWDVQNKQSYSLNAPGNRFSSILFRDEVLTFFGSFFDPRPSKEFVWTRELGTSVVVVDPLRKSILLEDRLMYEGDAALYSYDRSSGYTKKIADDTAGFAIQGPRLVYSSEVDNLFQISEVDISTDTILRRSDTRYHKWNPVFVDEGVAYLTLREGQKSVEILDPQGKVSPTDIEGYQIDRLESARGELKVLARRGLNQYPKGPEHLDQPEYPTFLHAQPIRQTLRLQNLAAAAAYDGDSIRYFFSGYADNLFSDKGVFVNSMFLGSTKFATIGYSDLNSGVNVSYFYNLRDGIENMGIDVAKNIIFDRYRQLTPYVDFEFQSYSSDSSAQNSFVTSAFDAQTFYLVKLGATYAYDVTLWDRHGPASGSRLFFKTETGFETQDPRLANVDANLDVRIYNSFLPRFGLAHRLSGGTSQGPIPNIFLIGGNMSFRGVGFDDLVGQNYWVFSEDLRLPVFDFVGAKFFDPLDQVLGFFSRYFDVRAGIYADVGATWMNNEDPDLKYSVGYFINIPTVFGLIVRLNQGFLGETNFGLWFGANW